MSVTPVLQRADEDVIIAWIRSLNDVAVKLTDSRPRVFEVGTQGTVLVADANLFFRIAQFRSIEGLRPGTWKVIFIEEKDVSHWQFHWISPDPLNLDVLPTEETCPRPVLAPLTEWEHIESFSVDSGKISVFDKDMMQKYIAHTGDERLVISVCQDPFSSRMGYQGVLPGGFFSTVNDGGYGIAARRYDNSIVQLKVRG